MSRCFVRRLVVRIAETNWIDSCIGLHPKDAPSSDPAEGGMATKPAASGSRRSDIKGIILAAVGHQPGNGPTPDGHQHQPPRRSPSGRSGRFERTGDFDPLVVFIRLSSPPLSRWAPRSARCSVNGWSFRSARSATARRDGVDGDQHRRPHDEHCPVGRRHCRGLVVPTLVVLDRRQLPQAAAGTSLGIPRQHPGRSQRADFRHRWLHCHGADWRFSFGLIFIISLVVLFPASA